MNQKAKVTFFFFIIFDRNQPMTQPSAGKNLHLKDKIELTEFFPKSRFLCIYSCFKKPKREQVPTANVIHGKGGTVEEHSYFHVSYLLSK